MRAMDASWTFARVVCALVEACEEVDANVRASRRGKGSTWKRRGRDVGHRTWDTSFVVVVHLHPPSSLTNASWIDRTKPSVGECQT